MKTLFTAEVVSKGEPSGTLSSPDGLLNFPLGKLLFAGAYSACYHGALVNAAKTLGTTLNNSTVRALVSLVEEDDDQGYCLAVEMHARLPGVDQDQAQLIMEEANRICPYSTALRGEGSLKLVVD